MHKYVSSLLGALIVTLIPSGVSAQEEGKVGITMGFPESVGLVWHATETIAVRPEFSFSVTSSETEFAETSSGSFSTGLSMLFYLDQSDRFATYLSPRYAFHRSSATRESPLGAEDESTLHSHLFSGSFGAQYWFGERFSVFGELGVAYEHASAGDDDDDFDEGTSHHIGSRSAIGVVFYF
jgi:hypothetical protein